MQPNQFVRNTAPTPHLVGCKRYFLLAAAAGTLGLSYLAFVEPLLFGTEFDKAQIVFAFLAAFFFLGLLVWASTENDKDKVWGQGFQNASKTQTELNATTSNSRTYFPRTTPNCWQL